MGMRLSTKNLAQFLSHAAAVIFEDAAFFVGEAGEAFEIDLFEQLLGLGVEIFVVVLGVVDLERRLLPRPALGRTNQALELVEAGQAAEVPTEIPIAEG